MDENQGKSRKIKDIDMHIILIGDMGIDINIMTLTWHGRHRA